MRATETHSSSSGSSEGQATMVPVFRRLQNAGLPFIAIGLIGVIAAWLTDGSADHKAFWSSYYFGWIFWTTLSLGCITALFLHNTIRAQWGLGIMRLLEAGAQLILPMGLFFLPMIAAVCTGHLYDWSNPANVAHYDPLHKDKAHFFLNVPFFLIRYVVYFTFWFLTVRWMRSSGLRQDQTMDEMLGQKRSTFAAVFGIIHVLLLTLAFTDWLMSLTDWYSTLYGAWNLTKATLMATAFCVIVAMSNRYRKPYSDIVTPGMSRDLGNVLLGWTMFWGYTSVSQFLIIWSGNLPGDNSFYTARLTGGLVFVGAFIVFLQFFGPFLSLITGRAKRTPEILLRVSIWIFVVRIVDTWWDVVPFFRTAQPGANLPWAFDPKLLVFDLLTWLFFGGLWIAVFAYNALGDARRGALYPVHDPRLIEAKEALAHGSAH